MMSVSEDGSNALRVSDLCQYKKYCELVMEYLPFYQDKSVDP